MSMRRALSVASDSPSSVLEEYVEPTCSDDRLSFHSQENQVDNTEVGG